MSELERLQHEIALAIRLIQRLTDARRDGVSMVAASILLEDWAVNVSDSIDEEILNQYGED